MTSLLPDVIDLMVGPEHSSALDAMRAHRSQTRINAQESYLALFAPVAPSEASFGSRDRYAVATFVAGLHRQSAAVHFYADALARQDGGSELVSTLLAEANASATTGPYGTYPIGPLTAEDLHGLCYRVNSARQDIGNKLSAALEHAHLLVFHPRDASEASLQKLLNAGWSSTDIVTLSQLIAFLSFQLRVVSGLSVLVELARPDTDKPVPHAIDAIAQNPAKAGANRTTQEQQDD